MVRQELHHEDVMVDVHTINYQFQLLDLGSKDLGDLPFGGEQGEVEEMSLY